jgi:Amt family ammonium transporter
MFGKDILGLFGSVKLFANGNIDHIGLTITKESFLFFQTVFCATAATIVSGAMAERTRFIDYCIYSVVISAFIYPVVGHWIWGGGFLANMGFIDFAGSTAVHSVGGWCAVVGAMMLGPRIGKYSDNGKANAIPGHSLTLGALGVFILWLGWFGFNPASSLSVSDMELNSRIFITTNLAAAAAATTTMIVTWIRYKKPDVSMTLNGVLAGLVAITAGCHVVTPGAAIIIGVIAGFVVVFGVEFIDKILKIDDPVGAIGVHCLCGVTGTLMVGLFATYGDSIGLFYGGGFKLLGIQTLGILCVAAWTIITSFILFKIVKATVGLRVSKSEELRGLDYEEHGIENSYADFQSTDINT